MSDSVKFKLNIITGEIEIEGDRDFVEGQIKNLELLIKTMTPKPAPRTDSPPGNGSPPKPQDSGTPPQVFGEWLQSFKVDINDLDKALITARYVQSESSENEFKTSEVNKALKDHGVKLSNPSVSLKRLTDKKYIFQTRKDGKLKYMRVSTTGQDYLNSIKASDES